MAPEKWSVGDAVAAAQGGRVGSGGGWSLSGVFDVVAAAAPQRDMVVWESTRRTYADVAARTRALAAFLAGHGLGAHRERDELERWELGQSPVALVLHNCPEYLEAMLGCYRARAAPFNVNQHYKPAEVRSLLDMVGSEAVIYHRSLGPLVGEALADRRVLLIDVDDGSGTPPLAGSTNLEAAVTAGDGAPLPTPSPDDLYLVCTGGTTGSPKAVLWRQADIYVAGMGGSEQTSADTIATAASTGAGAWFAVPPLMHAAAQWTAFGGLLTGATIVLHDDSRPFDAGTILATAAGEQVMLMSIVGDAYARPLVEELRRTTYDLSSLHALATGGAATNETYKAALFELLPHVTIVEGYGASETGGMAFGVRSRDTAPGGFAPAAGAAVLSADRTRFLTPGEDEVGWTARGGRVPLGYLDDRDKTEATFPVVDGQRVSVPGDRARLAADGTITMLGRDSMVVNTGGEKVFVEEVEEVLRRHPDVVDALVVGRPSERYGEEVVAVVQLRQGAATDPAGLRDFVATSLARFKAPRAIAVCERIARHANGKADYRWARSVAANAVDATAPAS
jgi:acyl-CoA synthetase (AMP-forming)/AMP-acid ligase II